MNILLIDPAVELEDALRFMGHAVMVLRPGPGVFHLPGILRHMNFTPDLVFQQESLGPRAFFGGLERLDCPTVFWAIDSHLNMFWQQWYAMLFDAVFTPHLTLFRALPAGRRPRELHRFAWPGQRRRWIAHERRTHAFSLCARLDKHRPVRGWLVELLRPRGLHFVNGLPMDEMMRLYDDSRLVVNECITNEVNFRLLEGASSGCLVLSPAVGEDQDALLLPGKEFLVYHDGLELLELTAWAQKRPAAAEAMGRAAMRRVLAGHLPEQRAFTLLRLTEGLSQHRLTGQAASLAFWIVLALQVRNQRMSLDPHDHARAGLDMVHGLPPWSGLPLSLRPLVSQVIAQCLCIFAEKPYSGAASPEDGPYPLPAGGVPWPVDEAFRLCHGLLSGFGQPGGKERLTQGQEEFCVGQNSLRTAPAREEPRAAADQEGYARTKDRGTDEPADLSLYACPDPAHTLELASVASAFALRQGQFRLALAFWLLHAGKEGKTLPHDPVSLCLCWAAAWKERGNFYAAGSGFVPERGFLPECALHYLAFAQTLNPDAARLLAKWGAPLLADRRDLLFLRIGNLANLCMACPEDWRLQLEYGLACVQACRVEAGLFEVAEACAKADQEGKNRLFQARLKAWPGSRRIRNVKETLIYSV